MSDAPPLPADVLKQRVEAACRLNGIGMRRLRGWLKARRIPGLLAEDMINGTKPQDFRNRRDLAETLSVPIEWFSEPEWWTLIKGASEPTGDPVVPDESEAEKLTAEEAGEGEPTDLDEPDEGKGSGFG